MRQSHPRHVRWIDLIRSRASGITLLVSFGTVCEILGSACAAPVAPRTETPWPTAASSSHIARDVVDALKRSGLHPGHPVDTSAADCPTIGCAQSITTERMQVLSFRTSGAAQVYAADHGMRQVMTVVVAFAPTVHADERQAYWAAITRLVS